DDTWQRALLEVRVELAFQVPNRVTLRFFDPGYTLLKKNKVHLATPVVVAIPGQGDVVAAEVTGLSVEQLPGEQPELVVVAHDKSHRLGRATKVATYQSMTYSAIVEDLARKAGLTPKATSTGRKLDYVLQIESDLALLTELANRVGFDWWVDPDGNLLFQPPKPSSSPLTLQFGDDLHSFSVRTTGHRPDSVKVVGWDRTKQTQVESSPVQASSANVKPSSTFADLVKNPGSSFGGSAELVSAGLAAGSADEAKELSTALLDRAVAGAVTAKGVANGNAKITPGASVKIEGFGPLDGTYHVTEADHVFRPTLGLQTRFTCGDRVPTTLVDTLNGNGHKSMVGTIDHAALVVGEVTSINDPDKRGRVRVRFSGLSSKDESAWARLVAVGGGKQRGMVFIPEVGDEVLVGFENGDVRQPVVLGGLFGDKSAIPTWDVKDGKVSARRLTSRKGHYVELSDGEQPTEQHILMMLQGNQHKLRLGKDRFDLTLPRGKPGAIKIGEASITVADNGDMTIEAPNITLKAKLKVSVEASTIELKANAQLSASASGKAELKGATVAIEGQSLTTVKGNAGVQIN